MSKFRQHLEVYRCDCGETFHRIGDAQAHILEKHPAPPRKKKPPLTIVQATRKEKLRKPTALERRQIRQAIAEGKRANSN